MMMTNPLRQALDEHRLAVGHMVMQFVSPAIAPILRPIAPDFVLFDLEHTGQCLETLADTIIACRLAGLAPIVRVPHIHSREISRCLDIGALGIMVPNVETLEEAQYLVNASKYPPLGKRGMGLGGAHNDYIAPNPQEYATWANEQIVLIPQIESTTGLANVAAIAALPGIDIAWVGALDLSLSLGIPGQFADERFIDALKLVAETCKIYGKGAGIQPGSLTIAKQWQGIGYNVISFATDIAVYQMALSEALGQLRG